MSSVTHISRRPLRRSVALVALAALLLGAVPAAACADGDDCGMVVMSTQATAGCGGDSCPLAAAVDAVTRAPSSPVDGSFACCAGPELDTQAPALLSPDRPEDTPSPALAVAALTVGTTSASALADATPEIPARARPGEGSVALHRLHSIDLC